MNIFRSELIGIRPSVELIYKRMYDKKQIIKEIQRVAAELGQTSLERTDFISRTMIPEKTIDFYVVSWQDVLEEAGLEQKNENENKISDHKLLEDLIRLFNQYGEIPTLSLINDSGKYSASEYTKRWRTPEDALNIAKKKFPEYIEKNTIDMAYEDKNSLSDSSIFNLEDTLVSINREDLILNKNPIRKISEKEKINEKKYEDGKNSKTQNDEIEFNFSTDNVGLDDLAPGSPLKLKKKKNKIIPETIKPESKQNDTKKKIDFRGLKKPPESVIEVIYLFGMICEELSFFIESFEKKENCFTGKRIPKGKDSEWQKVKIIFAANSSEKKADYKIDNKYDLLICWNNDWDACPIEILELKSTIRLLENYSPDEK